MLSGINIVGSLYTCAGTTAAARATIEALKSNGVPVCVWSRRDSLPGREPEVLSGVQTVASIAQLPYSTTLVLDSVMLLGPLGAAVRSVHPGHRLGAVVYWELEQLPLAWREPLEIYDVLFAPTEFVRQTIEKSLRRHALLCPVVPYTPATMPTRNERPAAFKFFLHFDILSLIERKNPLGAITAFTNSFGSNPHAELIIKAWGSDGYRLDAGGIQKIERENSNIRFITDHLTYEETLSLVQASDAYISLHRAEGLGLGILEAMRFGKPVIATDYSGPHDFLRTENAMPLPYTLIPVNSGNPWYQPEAIGSQGYWADPDLEAASIAMQRLCQDKEHCLSIGHEAQAYYHQRESEFLALDWLQPLCVPNGAIS